MKKILILGLAMLFAVPLLQAGKATIINRDANTIAAVGWGLGCANITRGRALACGGATTLNPGDTKKVEEKGNIKVWAAGNAEYEIKGKLGGKTFNFPTDFKRTKAPLAWVKNNSKEPVTVIGKGPGCLGIKKGITLVCKTVILQPGASDYIKEKGTIYVYDAQDNRYEVSGNLRGRRFNYPKDFSSAGVNVQNTTKNSVMAIARRAGCLGTSQGETLTCRSKEVPANGKTVLDIKYPYSDDFELIILDQGKRYISTKKFNKKETAVYPKDFRPALKGASATIQIKNTSDKPVTFVSRRTGCLGTSKGMTITCKTENVAPEKTGLMGIKYPYKKGFELVAFSGKDKFLCDRKVNDADLVDFPKDFTAVNHLIPVNNKLRYDQVSTLCSHNSFSSTAYGFAYAQQNLTITQQLNLGVRTLMLDTHLDENCEVKLCHDKCSVTKVLKPGTKPHSLKSALIEIKKWLDDHKSEVVTINLEDYMYRYKSVVEAQQKGTKPPIKLNVNACKNKGIKPEEYMDLESNVIESVPGLKDMILTKSTWDPEKHNGEWPTLAWLQKLNKRIIIFSSDSSKAGEKYIYSLWQYTIESGYSSLNPKKICAAQRVAARSSVPRRLYLLNYFPEISMGIKRTFDPNYNSYGRIWNVINTCKKISEGLLPNQIAVDFVDKNTDDLLHVINQLNKMQQQRYENMKAGKK